MHADPQVLAAQERVVNVAIAFGSAEATALLQRFGVTHVGYLLPQQLVEFIEFADAVILFGVPPSASWQGCVPAEYL
jgi:hypothetical protein